MSDDCHRKLIVLVMITGYPLLVVVGDSQFIFYGDCQGMLRLQKQPKVTLRFLTYSYVPPFCFQKDNHQTIPTLF